jgi:hypothetical protein
MSSKLRLIALNVVFGLATVGGDGLLPAQEKAPTASAGIERSLKLFLQKTLEYHETTGYVAAFRDLNGGGTEEAIILLSGYLWCGSGGCTMLVLTRERGSWKQIGRTTITRPPIYVLASSSHGWKSVAVWVQGGGIQPGYEAELPFDGSHYAPNPTLPPAKRLKGKPDGELVIRVEQKATPLYDSGR